MYVLTLIYTLLAFLSRTSWKIKLKNISFFNLHRLYTKLHHCKYYPLFSSYMRLHTAYICLKFVSNFHTTSNFSRFPNLSRNHFENIFFSFKV